VQANGIPAQYGRTTSAIINQATRSGSNQFHGNASWSHLDPYFQTQAVGAAFPPTTHYNHIALAIGGPVIIPKLYNGRNRTFFWATGEPQRLKLFFGATRSILPTADELAGKFNNSYDLLDSTLRQRDINAAIASPLRGNSLRYHQDLNAQGFPIGEDLPTAQRPIIPNNDLSAQLSRNPLAQRLLKQLFPFTPGQSTPFIPGCVPTACPTSTAITPSSPAAPPPSTTATASRSISSSARSIALPFATPSRPSPEPAPIGAASTIPPTPFRRTLSTPATLR